MTLSTSFLERRDERLRARRLTKRELRKHDSEDYRCGRIAGHEKFWINAITFRLESQPSLKALIVKRGYGFTYAEIARLLATDAQARGRTFTETLMHVAFNLCRLGSLKEQ